MRFYSSSIVTVAMSCVIFEIKRHTGRKSRVCVNESMCGLCLYVDSWSDDSGAQQWS